GQAWELRVHFNVDALVRLDAHDELISRNVLKDPGGNVLKLNADFRFLLVQRLSRLHNEGHTIPTLVFDVDNKRAEGGTPRVLRSSVVLLVCRLATVKRLPVLADDNVLRLDSGNSTKYPHLLVANVLCGEGNRPLHCE